LSTYTLHETRVLCDGREELNRCEVRAVVTNAMRRKLRLAGYDAEFWRELETSGESVLTWNFTRHNARNEREWISFQAWTQDATYTLHCVGPQAEYAIERVNKVLADRTPKWLRKKLEKQSSKKSKRRVHKKHKRLREKQLQRRGPKQRKLRKTHIAIASHQHEQLTPQFRRTRLFWNEALDATVAIFDIRHDGKNAARAIAARKLWRSLEHTNYRFAQVRQEGFCLQFTIVDGRWRGIDLTPVTVSCTKDNRNPIYRRMRKWLKKKLHGMPSSVQMTRRELLLMSDLRAVA
jgi:hypothetical protein